MKENIYYSYSEYLKNKYHEKVYKLPVNLPVSCPNRLKNAGGCAFCAEKGTGFESHNKNMSVTEQLAVTKELVEKKYHAHKFIAYFQNYTNTFLPLEEFKVYIEEAAHFDNIVEIAVSTRPDCVSEEYLKYLKEVSDIFHIQITIELGLQTANYHTLNFMRRGHGLAEFIDAVLRIQRYQFDICTHIILNLPGDEIEDSIETAKLLSALKVPVVKIHSLYIAKNSLLCDWYKNGKITLCSKDEYLNRLIHFIEYLSPEIAIERLFSRIPKEDAVFCNWGTSWWKLKDEFEYRMMEQNSFQGKSFHYLNGAALKLL
ncbi:MAG: TIGR01212 family radical SAM protein [Eubacteriales bacterium]|nr:TIGR01212 family radical SAM protein [Eubacteriales bacterium]